MTTRLRALARREAAQRQAALEHCELCAEPIPAEHQHVLDLVRRELQCTCRACALLFASDAAGMGNLRLVPGRRLRLEGFELSDLAWEELRLPVDIAFLFESTPDGRVVAFYPSPMGPTESELRLDAWDRMVAANPVLATLEPDVEALLVNRARGCKQAWLVPIDECYALVGVIRTRWRGLTGGKDVWEEVARFFERLDARARPAPNGNEKEATWLT